PGEEAHPRLGNALALPRLGDARQDLRADRPEATAIRFGHLAAALGERGLDARDLAVELLEAVVEHDEDLARELHAVERPRGVADRLRLGAPDQRVGGARPRLRRARARRDFAERVKGHVRGAIHAEERAVEPDARLGRGSRRTVFGGRRAPYLRAG